MASILPFLSLNKINYLNKKAFIFNNVNLFTHSKKALRKLSAFALYGGGAGI